MFKGDVVSLERFSAGQNLLRSCLCLGGSKARGPGLSILVVCRLDVNWGGLSGDR